MTINSVNFAVKQCPPLTTIVQTLRSFSWLFNSFSCLKLKGTVQWDFRPPVFFIIRTCLGPLTNGLKYIPFWFRFRRDIRGVMGLFRILFKGRYNEIFVLFFHNLRLPGPLSKGLKYFRFLLRFRQVIRFFRDWLCAVSYCGESSSAQYDTAQSHSMLRGVHSHFWTHLHRPLKGQWNKNKCGFLFYY